jgi:hypothetical protein
MVSLTYQQRLVMQWLIVAVASLLAVASFLAAIYHRNSIDPISSIAEGRRRHMRPQRKLWLKEVQYQRQQQQSNIAYISNNSSGLMLCNGLANLCDRRVNQIVFATVHNAMSAVENGSILVKNNILELERAISAGYRGINIDIGKCYGEVRLVHDTCLLSSRSLSSVLIEIAQFLQENPNEVMIIPTQLATQLADCNTVSLNDIDQVFRSVPEFYNLLYNHPGPGQPWPTLRELIAANTRILFFHYNGVSCTKAATTTSSSLSSSNNTTANVCPHGFHPWFVYAAETQFQFKTVRALQTTNTACAITRGGSGQNDFLGINVFITPARIVPTWKIINRYHFLKSQIQACSNQNNGQQVNLIFVNYWGIGDLLNVVYDLNSALV